MLTEKPLFNEVDRGNSCTIWNICGYSLGEGANSLVMNSVSTFAMLYYTQALGLNPVYAGFAMSIAVFWDAISDPIMGYITDHTRSRFGRRHPYILIGGLFMAVLLYAIWAVPSIFQTSQMRTFSYLVVMNLLLRTALTVFFVPYCAVGFEMTTDYEGRSLLQGMRQVFNMAANFLGPAMAWVLFFPDLKDGRKSTDNPANYVEMGQVFALAVVVLTVLTIVFTYRYRSNPPENAQHKTRHGLKNFLVINKEILLDRHARWVYAFSFLAVLNMVIVSSLLTYFYIYFMKIGGQQIAIAQFSAVIGCALGGLLATKLPHWFEKKGTILMACGASIFGNIIVAVFYLTGVMGPEYTLRVGGMEIPVGYWFFVIFNGLYWLGAGIMIPTALAMIADIAEINKYSSGELKDGSYSSLYSLIFKAAISFAMLVSGFILSGIGFDANIKENSPVVIWRLGAAMLLVGPVVCLFASVAICKYKVSRAYLEEMRSRQAVC